MNPTPLPPENTLGKLFEKAVRAVAVLSVLNASPAKPAPRWKSKRELEREADVREGERLDGMRVQNNRVVAFIVKTWSLPVACKFIRQSRRIGKGRRG